MASLPRYEDSLRRTIVQVLYGTLRSHRRRRTHSAIELEARLGRLTTSDPRLSSRSFRQQQQQQHQQTSSTLGGVDSFFAGDAVDTVAVLRAHLASPVALQGRFLRGHGDDEKGAKNGGERSLTKRRTVARFSSGVEVSEMAELERRAALWVHDRRGAARLQAKASQARVPAAYTTPRTPPPPLRAWETDLLMLSVRSLQHTPRGGGGGRGQQSLFRLAYALPDYDAHERAVKETAAKAEQGRPSEVSGAGLPIPLARLVSATGKETKDNCDILCPTWSADMRVSSAAEHNGVLTLSNNSSSSSAAAAAAATGEAPRMPLEIQKMRCVRRRRTRVHRYLTLDTSLVQTCLPRRSHTYDHFYRVFLSFSKGAKMRDGTAAAPGVWPAAVVHFPSLEQELKQQQQQQDNEEEEEEAKASERKTENAAGKPQVQLGGSAGEASPAAPLVVVPAVVPLSQSRSVPRVGSAPARRQQVRSSLEAEVEFDLDAIWADWRRMGGGGRAFRGGGDTPYNYADDPFLQSVADDFLSLMQYLASRD